MKFRLSPLAQCLNATLVLTLAACGGGGGGGETPAPEGGTTPPPSAMVTLTGSVMVNQAIRNATVCLDLNANNACDAGEPASARTGADGTYSLTYDAAQVPAAQVAAASLIAPMVPGALTGANTTIDAGDPSVGNTAKAYVLKQVPGKSGQINPLTTLVATGMAQGMTEAAARAGTAAQLAIAEGKIDNYQDDPAFSEAQVRDTARMMAQITAAAIEEGATLAVADPLAATSAAPGDLASLTYTNAGSFFYRTLDILAKAAGLPGTLIRDTRAGSTNGAPTAASALYNQAYLGPNGWVRCDDAATITGTGGSPSRSTFCGALDQVGFTVPADIAGQSMATLVGTLQADPATNTINASVGTGTLTAALGAATFPAGSTLRVRTSLALTQPVFVNAVSTDARPAAETTLEQTISARPASGVNLPNPGTSLTLGLGSATTRNLRVAFTGTTSATAGTVQFYECDLDSTQTVPSNCSATTTGTYAIGAVGGMRVMRFAGHAPTVMNHTRVYAEVRNAPTVTSGNAVYQARENKPAVDLNLSTANRLNATAWAAMKARLGL